MLTDKPAGKPVAPKLVGELVAAIWYEKATPTVPLAVVALVITGAPPARQSVSTWRCRFLRPIELIAVVLQL